MCLHIGSSSQLTHHLGRGADQRDDHAAADEHRAGRGRPRCGRGCCTEFPDVRFALSEGGIGWIPYFLERIDYVYKHHRAWTGQDLGACCRRELFRERFITCFIDDAAGLKNRHDVGIEHDHAGSATTRTPTRRGPTRPSVLAASLDGIPDDEVDAITHQNAMRLFHYDPFAVHRP